MEGVSSYEQRSISDGGPDLIAKQHRVIIVDRHQPDIFWSTSNQTPTEQPSRNFQISRLFKRAEHDQPGRPISKILSRSESSLSLTGFAGPYFGPFCSNEWYTSKYTLLNFIPKNLYEQFRRIANFYFLVTAIIQILIPFSPVGPFTSFTPLVFVVSVTAIKQAYEDSLRHRSDALLNKRQCYVLRGKRLARIESKDIRVGDLVCVRNNEELPCDIVLLSSASSERCYITTSNLDGETSLKSRSCSSIQEQIGGIDKLDDTLLILECEQPSATLYEFNGSLRVPKSHKTYKSLVRSHSTTDDEDGSMTRYPNLDYMKQFASPIKMPDKILQRLRRSQVARSGSWSQQQKPQTASCNIETNHDNNTFSSSRFEMHEIPLDINNFLPRASRLCNTPFIYGLAVYTGKDTKLARNSQVKPNKFSSIEQRLNLFLMLSFLILSCMTLAAAAREIWHLSKEGAEIAYGEIILSHFLLYNYLMPISLYVTLEFVKFFGTNAVIRDEKMKSYNWRSINQSKEGEQKPHLGHLSGHSKSEGIWKGKKRTEVLEAAKCNSSDLNEELGQIEVLFSDKTGTLTENQMNFMACSLGGKLYRSVDHQLFLDSSVNLSTLGAARDMAKLDRGRHSRLLFQSGTQRPTQQLKHSFTPGHYDHRYLPPKNQLQLIDRLDDQEKVVQFLIYLCLCSTIALNEALPLSDCIALALKDTKTSTKKTENLNFDYRSASPDEESLISAAHQFGVILCKANDRESYILIKRQGKSRSVGQRPGDVFKFKAVMETKLSNEHFIVRRFERLMVLEFNSSRKRMSVIYRDCDNNCIIMVCKGSEEMLDCIDMARLNSTIEGQIDATLAHFEAFSRSGLRALLVASRMVSTEEYKTIESESKEIRMAIGRREYMLDSLYDKTERNLTLVGATAVEDSLQEGVPETIMNLKEAGVKVWLLTGDKVETAISVAYLCRLLDHDMRQFHLVRQRDMQACKKLMASFMDQLAELKRKKSRTGHAHSKSKPASSFKSFGNNDLKIAMIADGRSLHYAMKYAKTELAKLCKQCTCVLGCRLSPLQKAEVVAMIKDDPDKPITAAVGDGANDVSMIQEAHVGIGIMGKEGRQAANSSDFAIGRFKKLNRLLFVHGHLFYHRAAHITHYFFYKNTLFVMPQFLYSFYSISSKQSLYHPIFLIGFNLFFTSLPILIYGLYETHIPEDILENHPKLYKIHRNNSLLTIALYATWIGLGCLQALIAFYFLDSIWGDEKPHMDKNQVARTSEFSVELFTVVCILVTLKLYLIAKSHGWLFHLTCLLSIIAIPVIIYSVLLLIAIQLLGSDEFYQKLLSYMSATMFWFGTLGTTLVCLLPDLIWFVRDQVVYHKRMKLIYKYRSQSDEHVQH